MDGQSRPAGRSRDRIETELQATPLLGVDNSVQSWSLQAAVPHESDSVALALQHSLLRQRLPSLHAVETATRYLPSDPHAGVGGDWFDVIPLSGARVALVVGDVVGHGIQASAAMGRLRTAVRTLADVDLPAEELLTDLDALIIDESRERTSSEEELGATCPYVVFDPVSRRCTVASAGHPAPAVVRPDGTVGLLELDPGPPLGVGGVPFVASGFALPPGSLLALFTDGLIGARGTDLDTGLGALLQALSSPASSLDEVCDTVLESLLQGPPEDDVALLIAPYTPTGRHVCRLVEDPRRPRRGSGGPSTYRRPTEGLGLGRGRAHYRADRERAGHHRSAVSGGAFGIPVRGRPSGQNSVAFTGCLPRPSRRSACGGCNGRRNPQRVCRPQGVCRRRFRCRCLQAAAVGKDAGDGQQADHHRVRRDGTPEHLTVADMATAMTDTLGEPVQHRPVTPDVFRALGFPGADETGDMFHYADCEHAFTTARDLDAVRALHPGLKDFRTWLTAHRDQFHLS